jgi:Integrase
VELIVELLGIAVWWCAWGLFGIGSIFLGKLDMQIGLDIRVVLAASGLPVQIQTELIDFFQTTGIRPQRSVRRKNIVSTKTIEARLYGLISSIRTLIELGYHIQSVTRIGEKHLVALHQAWLDKSSVHAVSHGRIHNVNCYLRLLVDIHLGKPGVVAVPSDYAAECKRNFVAASDKSWLGRDVNVADVLDAIRHEGVHGFIVAAQLEMCWAFGLRAQESWLARPQQLLDQAINRELLRIKDGTKGGRARDVPVTDVIQIDVLIRAANLATGQRHDSREVHVGALEVRFLHRGASPWHQTQR